MFPGLAGSKLNLRLRRTPGESGVEHADELAAGLPFSCLANAMTN
jgi:hypothetical protein